MARLKPERIEEYKEHHRAVWPELEELYRRAGIAELSCFLHGNELLIFTEYDDALLSASRKWLVEHEVERKWQALMKPFADPGFAAVEFEEVYCMGKIR